MTPLNALGTSAMKILVAGMELPPAAAASVAAMPAADAEGELDMLLVGPHASARSSLALHFALHHSAESGLPALFLCVQDAVEQSVPLLPHMCDTSDPVLERLHIKYVKGHLDLQRFGCCLHMLQAAYSAVVVEDMSGVIKIDDRNTLIRTLALLVDGMQAYRAARQLRCPLLVTDSSDERRWWGRRQRRGRAPGPREYGGRASRDSRSDCKCRAAVRVLDHGHAHCAGECSGARAGAWAWAGAEGASGTASGSRRRTCCGCVAASSILVSRVSCVRVCVVSGSPVDRSVPV
eukprot:XP_001703244.1 hypothetical protein CHLREDRAFT_205597 [Chlamydomonas reinhardtii]